MRKLFSTSIFCLLLYGQFSAQVDTLHKELSSVQLPEVEFISEKRLEGMNLSEQARDVVVITRERIEQMPVTTVQEVLQHISGVDLRQRGPMGAQSDLSIMGSTFEQVLILINGIPMRDPQTGHNQMNLPVSLNQIERIEVLMGSASRIYGANAMAGAINIVTRVPGKESLYVQSYAGSNFQTDTSSGKTYFLTGGQASVGFGTEHSGHQIGFSFLETNGYRYNSQNSQQRVSYTGQIIGNKGKADIFASAVSNKFGANNFFAAPFDKNATEEVSTIFGGVRYEQTIGEWTIRPIIYTRYNHDEYMLNKFNPGGYHNNHYSTASGAELHTRRSNSLGAFGVGIESRLELIHSNNLGKHQRYFYALYAEQRFDFGEIVTLTAGANAQFNNDYGWKFYPGGELNVIAHQNLSLYANAGLSNRLPTYTDLFYSDAANIGNSELRPENSLNLELGAKWHRNTWFAQASTFSRESSDFIDFVRDSISSPWQPQNFSYMRMTGADFRTSYAFQNRQKNFGLQNFTFSAVALKGNFTSHEMLSKYAMEHLTLQLTSGITVKTAMFSHTFYARYAERFTGAEFGVMDYRLRFNSGNLSAFADITNIFDRKYVESGIVEMPGRWFRLGVEFKLTGKNK